MLLFYKSIDKSVFQAGFAIPLEYRERFFSQIGFSLNRGEKRDISLVIDDVAYSASILSINFDGEKYPNHKDMLQIRYSSNSDIAKKLQQVFSHTKKLIDDNLDIYSAKWISSFPEDEKEYMAVYLINGVLVLDCITKRDFKEESEELVALGEIMLEEIMNGDDSSAGIQLKTKVCKIRHLSRAIGDNLKKLYDYRCQICGMRIGETYSSKVIHAHHIDYFVKSMNNNADNIIIVCPNHHAVIHDQNPVFDRKSKTFIYPNGYVEPLKLNSHLK